MKFFEFNISMPVSGKLGSFRPGLSARRRSMSFMVYAGIFAVLILGACQKSQTVDTEKSGAFYKPEAVDCSLFTPEDAAAILEVPADLVTAKSDEVHPGFWMCYYSGEGAARRVAFSIKVAKSVEEASGEMEQYRSHLKTAGETSPFRENLKNGPFSEIADLGDDALWTDMNLSLTVRQGNVSIQITMPKVREEQVKVARGFLSRL